MQSALEDQLETFRPVTETESLDKHEPVLKKTMISMTDLYHMITRMCFIQLHGKDYGSDVY